MGKIKEKATTEKGLWIIGIILVIFVFGISFYLGISAYNTATDLHSEPEAVVEPKYFMGICVDSLEVEKKSVERNETLSTILSKYGISSQTVHNLAATSKSIFDVRNIKTGQDYFALTTNDSLKQLRYVVYSQSPVDFIIFSLGDSLSVSKFQKEVVSTQRSISGTISSSLYNAIKDAGGKDELSAMLADIYQWSIDFYGIQKDDDFTIIYEELSVDSTVIGIKNIIAARFGHYGKDYFAIGFTDDQTKGYWDEVGESLKKSFLKAPLKFSRISSKFSSARLHPVLRIVRAHYGVDYAAPSGTPVWAVANGTVIQRGYSGGNGNMIKIRHDIHNGRYTTGYLHLSGYAKGLTVGKRVQQGEVIGYVGSTGTSTGPHLDFRIWQNGKPVNPLKMTSEKGAPISDATRSEFMHYKDSIIHCLQRLRQDSTWKASTKE